MIIEPQFEEAGRFPPDDEPNVVILAPVRIGDEFGYIIDRHGQMVITPQFDNAFSFEGTVARVVLGVRDFYVDPTVRVAFETPGLYGSDFSEGLAQVQIGN